MGKTKIIVLLLLATLCCLSIFKLSSMTSLNSNDKSTDLAAIFIEDTLEVTNEYGITDSHPSEQKLAKAIQLINAPLRKVAHASVYFALAFVVCLAMAAIFSHKRYLLSCVLALIFCVVFAITDEYHQTFVSGRTGQALDVLIDSVGALAGILFYSTYHLAYYLGTRSIIDNQKSQPKTKERRSSGNKETQHDTKKTQ